MSAITAEPVSTGSAVIAHLHPDNLASASVAATVGLSPANRGTRGK